MSRPLKFHSPEVLQDRIDLYFVDCRTSGEIPTISGLAVALDVDRHTLLYYSDREEFCATVKRAKSRVEAGIEQILFTGKNAAGPIFNLKNNFGWRDEKVIDQTVKGEMNLRSITVEGVASKDA